MTEISPSEWEKYIAENPEAHILQTRLWGDLKSAFGWKARYVICKGADPGVKLGAQILFRRTPLGLSIGYIAKGPIGIAQGRYNDHDWSLLMTEVDRICRAERAIFLKLEPDGWMTPPATEMPSDHLLSQPPSGFQLSRQSIQPPRTLVVDLNGSEYDILARMRQKTRYNIRLGQKRGLVVRQTDDLETFHRLLTVTAERESFGVHNLSYYQLAYDLFHPDNMCVLLIAEYENQPLAVLMAFRHGRRAWYFYGASSNEKREFMPTYLLQWEAMRWARSMNCTSYDLWGVPDEDEKTLEARFLERNDGLWGVYRFKRGFGGVLCRSPGPWDRVYHRLFYNIYIRWASGLR